MTRGSQRLFIIGIVFALYTALLHAQTGGSQGQAQSNQPQTDQSQANQTQDQSKDQGIPDAPSAVQPPATPLPQPTNPSHAVPQEEPENSSSSSGSSGATQPPPKMPPVQTVPPGSVPRNQISTPEGVYKLPTVSVGEVLIPVTVKYSDGRLVEGLGPKDFTVLDNSRKVTLNFFTSDPFQLSVAVVLDLGMHEVTMSKVYESLGSLVGAFSPYDEFALYTYSSTVSQQLDFTNKSQRFQAALDQIKIYPGRNNGPQPLNDPFSMSCPMVNSVPVCGPPVAPVQTPTQEAHVLNDAILRAALDLGQREKTRRRVILVVSDGQEYGSQASYRDVLRILETRDIQVQAVVVGGGALPVFRQAGKFHLKMQGFWDLLPKYTQATGGGHVQTELTRNAIEDAYARVTSDVRNQYTMGYSVKATPSSMYHSIDVIVDRRGLKVSAKDGYYPAATQR